MSTGRSVQEQVDYLRNEVNRLNSSIIGLNVRITREMEIHKTTFRDIEDLKVAHQQGSEHLRHEHSVGDSLDSPSASEQTQE